MSYVTVFVGLCAVVVISVIVALVVGYIGSLWTRNKVRSWLNY